MEIFTLRNASGFTVKIITFGATIVSIEAPDRYGQAANVILDRRNLPEYETSGGHYGATIGRFANRIANGRFMLGGVSYQTTVNHGKHTLHGGARGFDKRIWDVEHADDALRLRLVSGDGDEGFPGRLETHVTFALGDDSSLRIDYGASTDKPTVVNFTNHSYFNLGGNASRGVAGHELTIDADKYTPVDAELIPAGEIASVSGTKFDFQTPVAIGTRDFDVNLVLDRTAADEARVAARVVDPDSGRTLEVLTTEPGLQFYNNPALGGFALETQHFPDSPNHANFPSTALRPSERFTSTTIYRFGVSRSL